MMGREGRSPVVNDDAGNGLLLVDSRVPPLRRREGGEARQARER
ncbi:hypothetical protein ABEX25_27655 [Paenibacillus thiaminolyticus]